MFALIRIVPFAPRLINACSVSLRQCSSAKIALALPPMSLSTLSASVLKILCPHPSLLAEPNILPHKACSWLPLEHWLNAVSAVLIVPPPLVCNVCPLTTPQQTLVSNASPTASPVLMVRVAKFACQATETKVRLVLLAMTNV